MKFKKPHSDKKRHYGYRFEAGRPQPPSESYKGFKSDIWIEGIISDKQYLSFDISSYFNSVYHHDLHAWFSALEPEDSNEINVFGRFLREINSGRSLDCLPQGLYPTKMIGNDFLRFVEENCLLKSEFAYRFMDDICLIDKDEANLLSDFALIQKVLGQKGLAINSAKTRSGQAEEFDQSEDDIEELKKKLLKRRRQAVISSYDLDDEDEFEDDDAEHLGPITEEEIDFAISLLKKDKILEEDAELVLIVMRDHVNRITDYLHLFTRDFPHLAKNFYLLCSEAEDKDQIAQIVIDALSSDSYVSEYQLFWYGMMLEKYLMGCAQSKEIIPLLYKHENATDISMVKILEIQDTRFGLPELREGFLREGRSDWLAWSSAVGSLSLKKQARNYLFGYFQNGSEMNKLIAEILETV